MSTNHVSVRLDAETIARIDGMAPQFSTQFRRATRSDVLRALILTALAGSQPPEPAIDDPAEPPTQPGRTDRTAGKGHAGKSKRDPR